MKNYRVGQAVDVADNSAFSPLSFKEAILTGIAWLGKL